MNLAQSWFKFLGGWAGREHDSSVLSFDEFAVLVELLRHKEGLG